LMIIPTFRSTRNVAVFLEAEVLPGLLAARHFDLMVLETNNLPFIKAATACGISSRVRVVAPGGIETSG